MEFPITVKDIKFDKFEPIRPPLFRREHQGKFVSVRPCGDEYQEDKTYLGVLLGDITISVGCSFNPTDGTLTIRGGHANPAIFIPELGKVVFGYESWWGVISGPDDLKKITDQDIADVWYVQALKQMEQAASEQDTDA